MSRIGEEADTPTWRERFRYQREACPNPDFHDSGTALMRARTEAQVRAEREKERDDVRGS